MIEKFFTTEQVANILQVHPFTILKLIKHGKLQGIKLGRVYRIKESDVKEFLDSASSSRSKKQQPEKQQEIEIKVRDDQQVKFQDVNKNDDDNQHYYII